MSNDKWTGQQKLATVWQAKLLILGSLQTLKSLHFIPFCIFFLGILNSLRCSNSMILLSDIFSPSVENRDHFLSAASMTLILTNQRLCYTLAERTCWRIASCTSIGWPGSRGQTSPRGHPSFPRVAKTNGLGIYSMSSEHNNYLMSYKHDQSISTPPPQKSENELATDFY